MVVKYSLAYIIFYLLFDIFAVNAAKSRKIQISYPVEHLIPVTGNFFSGNATKNKLQCFGNRDYGAPTYKDTLLCILHLYLPFNYECVSLWGSRTVVVESIGSVEFYKVARLPKASIFHEQISVNATRFLELTGYRSDLKQVERKQIPAEPIYLCVRAINWLGNTDSYFQVHFESVYTRFADRLLCSYTALVHIAVIICLSSIWLLPYVMALITAIIAYQHGLKFVIALLTFSAFVVSLTPLMLTRRNRHLARLYISYYFTRIQVEETKLDIKKRMPLFQALYFSCMLVCCGVTFSYIAYIYIGIDREIRNMLIKLTISIASSWFLFFVCRSFERFFHDWIWVGFSIGSAQYFDQYVNPMSRNEVIVATLIITLSTRFILRIFQMRFFGRFISSPNVSQLFNAIKAKSRIGRNLGRNFMFKHFLPKIKSSVSVDRDLSGLSTSRSSNLELQAQESPFTAADATADTDDDELSLSTMFSQAMESLTQNEGDDDLFGEETFLESEDPYKEILVERKSSFTEMISEYCYLFQRLATSSCIMTSTANDNEVMLAGCDDNFISDEYLQSSPINEFSESILSVFESKKVETPRKSSSESIQDVKTESALPQSTLESLEESDIVQKNRQALENHTGIDLKSISTIDLGNVKSTAITDGHDMRQQVGSLRMPLSTFGPIKLDGFDIWVPIITREPSLVALLQLAANAVGECKSFIFEAEVPFCMSASFSCTTVDSALNIVSWTTSQEHYRILRSLVHDSFTRFLLQHFNELPSTELSLSVTASGRKVYIRMSTGTRFLPFSMVKKASAYALEQLLHSLTEQFDIIDTSQISVNDDVCDASDKDSLKVCNKISIECKSLEIEGYKLSHLHDHFEALDVDKRQNKEGSIQSHHRMVKILTSVLFPLIHDAFEASDLANSVLSMSEICVYKSLVSSNSEREREDAWSILITIPIFQYYSMHDSDFATSCFNLLSKQIPTRLSSYPAYITRQEIFYRVLGSIIATIFICDLIKDSDVAASES